MCDEQWLSSHSDDVVRVFCKRDKLVWPCTQARYAEKKHLPPRHVSIEESDMSIVQLDV